MTRNHVSAEPNGTARPHPLKKARSPNRQAESLPHFPALARLGGERRLKSAFALKLERYERFSGYLPKSVSSLMTRKRTFEPGMQLSYHGEPGGVAFIIEDGWTFSSKLMPGGARQILDIQIPGDVAGLQNLPVPFADHDVTALTKVIVHEVRFSDLANAISSDPGLAGLILWLAASDSAVASERLIDIGQRSALERMAHFILELATRLRLAGLSTHAGFPCPMTQYVLGDALGLTSVHVNRVLRDLRTARLAHHRRGWISLLDIGMLSEVARFDAAYLDHTSVLDTARN
ncbi:MAG: Crp/Fnr family transcriptional regulator [Hyphomonas sp.]